MTMADTFDARNLIADTAVLLAETKLPGFVDVPDNPFSSFDDAMSKIKARKPLVFDSIKADDPDAIALQDMVDNLVGTWEVIGMVVEKAISLAEKYVPLLLA